MNRDALRGCLLTFVVCGLFWGSVIWFFLQA